MACPSAATCEVVGWNSSKQGVVATVTDGTLGSAQVISAGQLSGVACPTATTCEAVGKNSSNQGVLVPITSISVTAPTVGTSWARGSSHSITWSSVGSFGAHVNIQLFKAGKLVKTIAKTVLTSAGTYTWNIGATLASATTCQIKILSTTKSSIFGISLGYFSIT